MDDEQNPLDMPPIDGLEGAFELPQNIKDDAPMLALHTEIVERLRREASGLPMRTIQNLLIARISYFYVAMMMAEREGGNLRQQKEMLTFWLSMTQEFNRLLEKNMDKLVDEKMMQVEGIVKDILLMIPDIEVRREIRRALKEKFEEVQL